MSNTPSPNSSDAVVVQVMLDVTRYLQCNPGAADTLNGIAAYWLPPDSNRPIRHVQEALNRLVANKSVQRNEVVGGAVIYSALHKNTDAGEPRID